MSHSSFGLKLMISAGDAAAVGFCTQLMSPVFAETDCTVNLFKIQGYGVGKTSPHIMHRGPVWVSLHPD